MANCKTLKFGRPQFGSIPFFLITAAAAGVRRKSISAFDAAMSLAPVMIAAMMTWIFCRSLGRGPTNSVPATGRSS